MKTGKVPENVLKRSVLRQIKTKNAEVAIGAGIGEDCAVFSRATSRTDMLACPPGDCRESEQRICEPARATSRTDMLACPPGDCRESEQRICEPARADNLRVCDSGAEYLAVCMQEAEITAETVNPAFTTIAQLIQRCANNLAAGGAELKAVLIGLILPVAMEESELKDLMAEAEKKCASLSAEIAGGQTRTSSAVMGPIAVVTGYGRCFEGAVRSIGRAAPGQDVVLSKWIGLEGTALLARRNREKLLARYPSYLVEEAAGFDRYLSVVPEAAAAVKSGVCAMHDVSEGGIFGALWELAEKAGVGLTIDMKKLPLRQETVEVCEFCRANPYELLSGGCLLMTTENGSDLVAALAAENIPATIVGKVTDGNDRILVNEDEIRYLDRAGQDAIYVSPAAD